MKEKLKLQIEIFDTTQQIASAVSAILLQQIQEKPESVLGFATGSSPVETYQKLIEAHKNGKADFSRVTTFNLDEYCALSQDDPHSYYAFMREQLFEPAGFHYDRVHFLSGDAPNHEDICSAYRADIARCGGIDIQLLGIGRNGHIGFNEPSDRFSDGPFMVELTQSTLEANARFFENGTQPRYALTMGIGDIMAAKKILLIATGESKAQAVRAMVKGEVTPQCPASVLQTHPDTTVFLDKESASLL